MIRSFVCSRMTGIALLACLVAVSGCSSGGSTSKIQMGPVTFTNLIGAPVPTPPQSLTVGHGTYVDVTLTDDPQLLGADWTAYCGSALPPGSPLPPGYTQDESCGTFTPGHTISGPIPSYLTSASGYVTFYTAPSAPPSNGTVTLYALAAADHSKFSTVTLTIGGLPISVGFAPEPPATLQAGASTSFKAVLYNDNGNAGVTWSVLCSSTDCGSFDPVKTTSGVTTTYTAPASAPTGGTVKVTATSVADPTKAASATISID
ncbi:hypothetical protein [Acidicapsa ligni]|uniref:hypothetical protein n=1 Tax=Acidicapsa ligni TaxID=542300 RepID=UPI0021E077B1|nr:hypothetical protein [Acidicapsa ligni]